MISIKLPAASWDHITFILSGPHAPEHVYEPLLKEIYKQLEEQEY
jgi:hypothetical protein